MFDFHVSYFNSGEPNKNICWPNDCTLHSISQLIGLDAYILHYLQLLWLQFLNYWHQHHRIKVNINANVISAYCLVFASGGTSNNDSKTGIIAVPIVGILVIVFIIFITIIVCYCIKHHCGNKKGIKLVFISTLQPCFSYIAEQNPPGREVETTCMSCKYCAFILYSCYICPTSFQWAKAQTYLL